MDRFLKTDFLTLFFYSLFELILLIFSNRQNFPDKLIFEQTYKPALFNDRFDRKRNIRRKNI